MSSRKRPVVLIFCDYYLPGYKSGGGMRTIVNMVDRLSHKYDFRIVTRDHDGKLDRKQYADVRINDWNTVGEANVFYLSKDNIRIGVIRRLIKEVNADSIYTNSCFSTLAIYVLILRRLGLIGGREVVLAPCGELAEGALGLKRYKKRLFLLFAKAFGLYNKLIWKVSTELEEEEVRLLKPKRPEVFVAVDLPALTLYEEYDRDSRPIKNKGEVRFAFLARYVRTKNFNWVLPLLKNIHAGEVCLDMIGPIENPDYWEEAKLLIAELPANVTVRALGSIDHGAVCEVLSGYHFYVSPTLGENFGHVFVEAMAAGCPILISDRTPWRNLKEKGVGWDISLNNPEEWIKTIEYCVAMENEEYSRLAEQTRAYACEWLASPDLTPENEIVLDHSLNGVTQERTGT